jgi:hypothetical protein
MKITATIESIRRALEEEKRAGERAVTRAIDTEIKSLQAQVRTQTVAAFGARGRGLANAWRRKVYPEGGRVSLNAKGVVWTQAPTIIDAFERGVTIRARGSKYLAIPTGFNAPLGRRGRGYRVSPEQMVASRQAFLRPFRNGRGFVWCLPVRQGDSVGRRRAPLIAGGLVAVATGRRKGVRAWQAALLRQGFVPMFLLVPQVRLAKRLDVVRAWRAAQSRLPTRVVAEWRRESRS